MSSIERIYQSVLRISHTLYVEETKNELDVILNDACEEIASLKKQLEDFSPEMTELRDACLLAQAQLAEREAECLNLRGVLWVAQKFCNSLTADECPDTVATPINEALSTPQSTTYLEQWEKSKYGEPVAYETYKGYLLHAGDPKVTEHSDPTPLYAREK